MGARDSSASRTILLVKERHAAELRDFQQRLLAKPTATRYSREYLNLRKIQETLAKAKE